MVKQLVLGGLVFLISLPLIAQKAEVYSSPAGAINGYDPVAYFKEGRPVKGNKQFFLDWKGARWYFSTKENRDTFQEAPEKYAPQYGGYCAYGCSEGHKASTKPEAFTITGGKLYLNYSLDVRDSWNKNRNERIIQADKKWPTIKNRD